MTEFTALGNPGSGAFVGLETFDNPGVSEVSLTSDEFTAVCPVTGQPDLYLLGITITYPAQEGKCVESKSLKIYLNQFRNTGEFCEALAVQIRDDVREAIGPLPGITVKIRQKRRGGISIEATT